MKRRLAILIFCIALIGVGYLFLVKLLIIRHIDCSTQFSSCPQYILTQLNYFQNSPLTLGFPARQINKSITKFSSVESVSIVQKLPDRLQVTIKLHTPTGVISTSTIDSLALLVGSDGALLGPASGTMLPLLILSAPLPSHLNKTQVSALHMLNQMTAIIPSRLTGTLDSSWLTVTAPNSPQILLDADSSDSAWYSSLQLILKRSKISFKLPQIIDLRFTNPVLTY